MVMPQLHFLNNSKADRSLWISPDCSG